MGEACQGTGKKPVESKDHIVTDDICNCLLCRTNREVQRKADVSEFLDLFRDELKMINKDCLKDGQLKLEYIEYKMICLKKRLMS